MIIAGFKPAIIFYLKFEAALQVKALLMQDRTGWTLTGLFLF
jgi:hypothetical protein